jgi:hypothetical protein
MMLTLRLSSDGVLSEVVLPYVWAEVSSTSIQVC